jgi:hypothetical protein
MDDITKKMCRQLSESYYSSNKRVLFEVDENTPSEDKETPEEDSDIKKFTPDNEFLKTFIKEMKDYVSSGGANTYSLTFNDLTFDKNLKRVVWSGNFAKKIDWKVVFQKNGDSGAFFIIFLLIRPIVFHESFNGPSIGNMTIIFFVWYGLTLVMTNALLISNQKMNETNL